MHSTIDVKELNYYIRLLRGEVSFYGLKTIKQRGVLYLDDNLENLLELNRIFVI